MASYRKVKAFCYRDYLVLGELGRGLSGMVYLAQAQQSGELVALKRLHQQADQLVRDFFLNEQRLLRKARHPHIVRYVEGGASGQESFLVTALVEGRPLANLIGRPMQPARVLRLLGQLASALDYLHSEHPDKPVIHCDVNPHNIIVGDGDAVTLLDLSSARASFFASADSATMLSPRYCAPEQLAYRPAIQSDQYALAVLAFELLAGRALFPEQPAPQARPPRVRALLPSDSGGGAHVLERALQPLPEARYRSCAEFVEQLARVMQAERWSLAGSSPGGAIGQPLGRRRRASSWQRAILGLSIAGVIASLPLAGWPARAYAPPWREAVSTQALATPAPGGAGQDAAPQPTVTLSLAARQRGNRLRARPKQTAAPLSQARSPGSSRRSAVPSPAPSATPSPPSMPELIGYGENQARELLALLGIEEVVVDYQGWAKLGELFDRYPAYAVVSSIPAPGAPLQTGQQVLLGVRSPLDERTPSVTPAIHELAPTRAQ